jgi:hypothetical protein
MNMFRRTIRTTTAMFWMSGCALFDNDVVCTAEPRPAIAVVITDSVSGAPLEGVAAVARDGAYRDSVSSRSDGYAFLAHSRGGRYDVNVRRSEYREWHASAVRVTTDECGPVMVTLLARLQSE